MRLDGMIQAGRLRIYDATPDDMAKVVEWLNDKALMRYSSKSWDSYYYARFS